MVTEGEKRAHFLLNYVLCTTEMMIDRRTIKKIVIITSYVLYSYSKNKVMQILYLFQYFKALPCFHSKTEN